MGVVIGLHYCSTGRKLYKSLEPTEEQILHKYCELVNEYLFHITEHIIIQNREYY